MIIVSGHLQVDPQGRDSYLTDCIDVVTAGRAAEGNLDFALSPDVVDPGRINILERWETQESVDTFRGAGVGEDQGAAILSASVAEYDVAGSRQLS